MSHRTHDRHIFLVGVKGSGKSVVGRLLARRLSLRFVDLDNVIERMFQDRTGSRSPVREIYRIDNGDTFRRLEAAACNRVARSGRPVVVATGGGICDNPEAAPSLSAGLVVHLLGDPEVLFARVMRRGIPPFLDATTEDEARAAFAGLYRRRSDSYLALADLTVRVGAQSPREAADLLADRIQEYRHGRK